MPIADKGILRRVAASLVLAGAALALFMVSRGFFAPHPEAAEGSVAIRAGAVDREIDSILARFMIEKQWTRKQAFPIPNSRLTRTERRVMIPASVQPVQMNAALNAMARRFDGRAVASENLTEGTVTIHIELEGFLVETIVLKQNPALRRAPKEKQTKV